MAKKKNKSIIINILIKSLIDSVIHTVIDIVIIWVFFKELNSVTIDLLLRIDNGSLPIGSFILNIFIIIFIIYLTYFIARNVIFSYKHK